MKTKILKLSIVLMSIGMIGNAQTTRNCGTMENLDRLKALDPQLGSRMDQIEQFTQQWITANAAMKSPQAVKIIPVVVHVVYKYSSQNISDAQIQSQINVLTEDFRRTNADGINTPSYFASAAADAQIEFCLAVRDPSGNATNGITRTSTTVTSFSTNDYIKFSSTGGKNAWPSNQYLNIWVGNLGGGLLGYGQFPGGAASTDGVVIHYQYFGSGGSALYPFDKGRTATHEVGHWLNLRHIWGDSYCGNDYVNDTPTQQYSSSGCPSYPRNTCGSSDMFMNYMDYTNDACMNMFSGGQRDRMRALFSAGGARASILNSQGCVPVGGGGYCASQGSDASYEWIADVNVASIHNNTGTNGGYADFTNISTDLERGSSNAVSLTPGFNSSTYNEYWKIWIDFNQDGDFSDAGELAFDAGGLSNSTVTGNLNVSPTASLGMTRMRVSMKYNGAQTACETFSYGEIEDYSVNIIAPCTVPGGLDALNITSTSATLKFSSTGASGYDVRIRVVGAQSWSTSSTTNTSISATGLSPATTYEFQVRSACSNSNSAYSGSYTFTTLNAGGAYCSSQGNDASYEWIAGVTVASIDNNTASNGGYADFTGISTDLEQGSSNAVTLTPGFSSSTYNEYWKIWIDLNQDGDFSDAGELVFDARGLSNTTVTGNLDVPLTASLGTTRMRVSMKYNGEQTACETFTYGEVEDYTVNIVQPVVISYCSSAGSDASYEWIEGVSVGTINNTSGSNSGYGDYTGISTTLEQGLSYPVTLTPGFSSTVYNEYWKIWIDFNRDGDFDDAGELAFDAGGLSNSTVTGNLNVPSNASLGITRMRVTMKYNAAPSSCGSFQYGEVEDYTVDIADGNKTTSVYDPEDAFDFDFDLYPNPAQSASTVSFSIPEDARSVVLNVYDLQGKLVHTNSWNGRNGEVRTTLSFDDLPGGVYHVSVQAGEFYGVKKLVVIK